MSNLEQFYNLVQNSQELQEQLGAVENEESFNERAVRLGQENGYTFTAEDVKVFINLKSQEANPELSEQELEAVAGGNKKYDPSPPCPRNTNINGWTTMCMGISRCEVSSVC
jgi:predicted ribosomally synthesized peptide with nif11-like leader